MRALLASTFLLLLCACPSPDERTDSVPDPRLGVVVFETNARPFSRAPPLATVVDHDGHVVQNRGRLALAADGSIFVLIGLDAARPFGTANDVTPSRVVVKKLSPGDALTELPAPVLGSGGALRDTTFVVAGDGEHPAIIDVHGADNPQGRFVAVTTFDGLAWKTVSFLRGDRPPADVSATWDAANDQVRVLRPGVVVVQHGDALTRHDGTGWAPVTLPPRVKELRLGTADASRVRAYWLTTDGALESDVLRDDGTWEGAPSRLLRGTTPTLRGAWGFAGDLDTFTVHFLTSEGLRVVRHEGGRFRLALTRPPAVGETTGGAFLMATRHPWRTAFVNAGGTLQASYAGAETGSLGTVIGYTAGPAVTCEGDVTVGEGMVLAKDGAKCVPRALDGLDFRLDANLGTLVELFADPRQDATLRLYVKRIPLPSANADVTRNEPATGGFPGDPGTPPTPGDKLLVTGHVLTPGASDHSGTTCQLLEGGRQLEVVQSDADGTVTFSPVPPGRYEAQCNRPLYQTLHASWPAGQLGEAALDGVLVHGLLPPDDAPFPGTVEFALDGGALLERQSTGTTVLSTSVASGDFVRQLGGELVWKEASGAWRTTASSAVLSAPRALASFKLVGNQLVTAQGVPDGVTPLSWTLADGVTPLLATPAVEVTPWAAPSAPVGGCNGTVVWIQVAPGDVRAQRGDCNRPLSLFASSLSAAPVPVLRRLEVAASVAFGFAGAGPCGEEAGFATACPVHTLDVLGAGALSSTQLSAGALAARAQVVNGQGSRVLLLEPGGVLAVTAFNGLTRVELQTGLTLPSDWLPGETPMTPVDASSARFLVRTTAGVFVTTGEAGSWTKVADAARGVFPGGVVLLRDGALLRVLPSGVVEALALRGSENLRVAASGLWSDGAEMTCPDGTTCRVLQRLAPDGTLTSLAAGRLTPDVLLEPRRFGLPTSGLLRAQLVWPDKRVTLPP